MQPSIGRVVHYVSKIDNGPGNEVVSPAIVIATRSDLKAAVIERWGPEPTEVGPSPVDGKTHTTAPRPDVEIALHDDETVHLLVHGLGKDYREYGVRHDEDGGLGTWHWPPRVEG
jgi:hypothetical protein